MLVCENWIAMMSISDGALKIVYLFDHHGRHACVVAVSFPLDVKTPFVAGSSSSPFLQRLDGPEKGDDRYFQQGLISAPKIILRKQVNWNSNVSPTCAVGKLDHCNYGLYLLSLKRRTLKFDRREICCD